MQDNVKKLNVGDNFYIVATDVPDYWWDGTAKQELEVQKIDLTTYDNAITALRSKDEELKQSVAKTVPKTAILHTKEQISANTSAENIAGALALKEAMADYTNQFSQIYSNIGVLSLKSYYAAGVGSNDDAGRDYTVKLDAGATYIFVATKIGGELQLAFGLVSTYPDNTDYPGRVITMYNDRPQQITFMINNGTNFVMNVHNNILWIALELLKIR